MLIFRSLFHGVLKRFGLRSLNMGLFLATFSPEVPRFFEFRSLGFLALLGSLPLSGFLYQYGSPWIKWASLYLLARIDFFRIGNSLPPSGFLVCTGSLLYRGFLLSFGFCLLFLEFSNLFAFAPATWVSPIGWLAFSFGDSFNSLAFAFW